MTDRRAPNWIIYEDGAHLQGNQRPQRASTPTAPRRPPVERMRAHGDAERLGRRLDRRGFGYVISGSRVVPPCASPGDVPLIRAFETTQDAS
jgi:hypothetical protein